MLEGDSKLYQSDISIITSEQSDEVKAKGISGTDREPLIINWEPDTSNSLSLLSLEA